MNKLILTIVFFVFSVYLVESRDMVTSELGYYGVVGSQCHLNVVDHPIHYLLHGSGGILPVKVPNYDIELHLKQNEVVKKGIDAYSTAYFELDGASLTDIVNINVPGGVATEFIRWEGDGAVADTCCCAPFQEVFCGSREYFNYIISHIFANFSGESGYDFLNSLLSGNPDAEDLLLCEDGAGNEGFCNCLVDPSSWSGEADSSDVICNCCNLGDKRGLTSHDYLCATCTGDDGKRGGGATFNTIADSCDGSSPTKRGQTNYSQRYFSSTVCACPSEWQGPLSMMVTDGYQSYKPWLMAGLTVYDALVAENTAAGSVGEIFG